MIDTAVRASSVSQEKREQVHLAPEQKKLLSAWKQLPQFSNEGIPFRAYWFNHFKRTLKNILNSPITFSLTLVVFTALFFLFSLLSYVVVNIETALKRNYGGISMSLFLRENIGDEQRRVIYKVLQDNGAISNVRYITKAQAYDNFKENIGEFLSLLEGLDGDNPLPASFEVSFTKGTPRFFEELKAEFGLLPGIESVQYSRNSVVNITSVLSGFQVLAAIGLALTLFVASIVAINAFRLSVFSHRGELLILKILGASQWEIRLPYLIEGFLVGAVSSSLALVLCNFFHAGVKVFAEKNSILQFVVQDIHFLGPQAHCIIIVWGIALGVMASWYATWRCLDDETREYLV